MLTGQFPAQLWDEELTLPAVSARRSSRKKKTLKARLGTGILVVFSLYIFFNIAQMHFTIWSLDRQLEMAQQRKAELQTQQGDLQQQAEESNSDDYIEKLAREQLGLVKPGESVIIPENLPGDINN